MRLLKSQLTKVLLFTCNKGPTPARQEHLLTCFNYTTQAHASALPDARNDSCSWWLKKAFVSCVDSALPPPLTTPSSRRTIFYSAHPLPAQARTASWYHAAAQNRELLRVLQCCVDSVELPQSADNHIDNRSVPTAGARVSKTQFWTRRAAAAILQMNRQMQLFWTVCRRYASIKVDPLNCVLYLPASAGKLSMNGMHDVPSTRPHDALPS